MRRIIPIMSVIFIVWIIAMLDIAVFNNKIENFIFTKSECDFIVPYQKYQLVHNSISGNYTIRVVGQIVDFDEYLAGDYFSPILLSLDFGSAAEFKDSCKAKGFLKKYLTNIGYFKNYKP